jgi:small subunit ribosomal protein S6
MELYEIMLIIRPDLETEEQEEVLNGLSSVIAKNNGTVSTVLDWHKRRLAYEIEKHKDGHYYLTYFSAPGTIIPEIEHYFRVTDAIIRYMIVRSSEQEFEAAADKAAKEAARAAEPTETGEAILPVKEVEQSEAEEPLEAAEGPLEAVEGLVEAEGPLEAVEGLVEAEGPLEAVEGLVEAEESEKPYELAEADQVPAESAETEEPAEEELIKEEE